MRARAEVARRGAVGGLDRFVGLDRPLGPSPITPNLAMREDLYDARSYDVPVEQRYDRLWRRAIKDGSSTEFPTSSAVLTAEALPALRLLSVTHLVQDPGDPPVRPGLLLRSMLQPDTPGSTATGPAVTTLAVYAAVCIGIIAVVMSRRDVTA